jgi:hypothetical protein
VQREKALARELEADKDASPPLQLSIRVGVSLFFRLVRSLLRNNNRQGLMRVARQLPHLLSDMPPLALRPRPLPADAPQTHHPRTPKGAIAGGAVAPEAVAGEAGKARARAHSPAIKGKTMS